MNVFNAAKFEEGYEKAHLADEWPYLEAHIRQNILPGMVPILANTLNEIFEATLGQVAQANGERVVVTRRAENGQIEETLKLPAWAEVAAVGQSVEVPSTSGPKED